MRSGKEFAEWLDDFLVDRGYPKNPLNENDLQEVTGWINGDYAKELEEKGQVAIVFNDYIYIIHDAVMEDGYMVNKYDPSDVESGPMDGGLCTGSAQDAVEFLL